MKKLMIMAGIALSVLSVSALGGSGPVRAASNDTADTTASRALMPAGEDDDEGTSRSSGGGGSLPATGSGAASIEMIGALTLAAGGAT